jgi:hypothetical protein
VFQAFTPCLSSATCSSFAISASMAKSRSGEKLSVARQL